MANDTIVADPITFRVGYNSTVRVTVTKLGEPFPISDNRYTVQLRALERGAEAYALDVEIGKSAVDGEEAIAEGPLPAWAAATVGKTFKFWVVLIDSDVAPSGAATESGDFEEVLGEFTRTIQPGLAAA